MVGALESVREYLDELADRVRGRQFDSESDASRFRSCAVDDCRSAELVEKRSHDVCCIGGQMSNAASVGGDGDPGRGSSRAGLGAEDVNARRLAVAFAIVHQVVGSFQSDRPCRQVPEIGEFVVAADATGCDVQKVFPPCGHERPFSSDRYAITEAEHTPTMSARAVNPPVSRGHGQIAQRQYR